MKVKKGQKVKVEYEGIYDNGEVFDSSKGKEPLEFITGEDMVIKGFENAILDMNVGDSKKVKIEADDAYGPLIPELVQEAPREAFGPDFKPEVGMTLGLKSPTGQVLPAKILEVKKDKVKLDMNHPIAGQRLNFELKIIEAAALTKQEKEEIEKAKHGHEGHDCATCSDHSCK